MPASHLSPRAFCLHCRRAINSALLAHDFNITNPLFGFCSPICEVNYGTALEQGNKQGRRLSKEARELLAVLQARLSGAGQVVRVESQEQVVRVESQEQAVALELARGGLLVLRGRHGATFTVAGDISSIRARLLSQIEDERDYEESQAELALDKEEAMSRTRNDARDSHRLGYNDPS